MLGDVWWRQATLVCLTTLLLQGSALECNSHELPCRNGQKCIKRHYFCDGSAECPDHSDEIKCPDRANCKADNGFWCLVGNEPLCRPVRFRCDGHTDCLPPVDEENCTDFCSWSSWSACSATCGVGIQERHPSNSFPSCTNRTRSCLPQLPLCDAQPTAETVVSGNDVQIVIISTIAGFLFLTIAILVEVFMRRKFKLSRIWVENVPGHVVGQNGLRDDEVDLMSRLSGASAGAPNNSTSPQHSCACAVSQTTAIRLQCSALPEKMELMSTATQVPCSLLSLVTNGQAATGSQTHSPWNGSSCERLVNATDPGNVKLGDGAKCMTSQGKSLPPPAIYRITLTGIGASMLARLKVHCSLCDQGVPLGLKQSPLCQRQHAGNELQAGDLLYGDSCQLIHLQTVKILDSHLGESQSLTFTSLDESGSDGTDDRSSGSLQDEHMPAQSVLTASNQLPVPHVSLTSETSSSVMRNSVNKHCSPVWGNQPTVVVCESQSLATSGSDYTAQSAGGATSAPCNTSVSDVHRSVYDDLHTAGINDLYLQPVTIIESAA